MKHQFITYNPTGAFNLVINDRLALISQEDIESHELGDIFGYDIMTKNTYELEISDKDKWRADAICSLTLIKAVEKVITSVLNGYDEDQIREDLPALREELRHLANQMLPLTRKGDEDLEGILEEAWAFTRKVLILKYIDSSGEDLLNDEGPIINPSWLTQEFKDKYYR